MLRFFRLAHTLAFVGVLSLPVGTLLYADASHPCRPKRGASLQPWGSQLAACRSEFTRNFVVGPSLLATRLRWGYRLLGISTTPQALAGKGDWLFLNGGIFKEARCMAHEPFADGEQEAWVDSLASWVAYANEQNFTFVFFVGPDKHTIYPEKLPWHLQLHRETPSRLDTLLAALRSDPRTRDMLIVDPRQTLRDHKATAELYHHADAHWNDRAGFYAYEELVRVVQPKFPGLAALDASRFAFPCEMLPIGDTTGLLALTPADRFRRCRSVWPKDPDGRWTHPLINQAAWHATPAAEVRHGRPIRHLFMWRDSFAMALLPYMLAHTNEAHLLQTPDMSTEEVAILRPDLVVYQMVERQLYEHAPTAVAPRRGIAFTDGFYHRMWIEPLRERWMTKEAVLRVEPREMARHKALSLTFRLPARIAAAGPITYALGDEPARPVTMDGVHGRLVVAREDWPKNGERLRLTLRGAATLVPAQACGLAYDLRELTAAVTADWVDEPAG